MGRPYNMNYKTIKNSDYNIDKDRVMMTNITYELRDFANSGMLAMECATYSDKLAAIADRIDDRYSELRAILKERYIELPKDADNVSWNVGDLDEDGNEVIALKLTSSGWHVITDSPWPYRPDSHCHYHALTVEDVLREFAYGLGVPVADSYVAATAAKLRLAEGEDA